MNKNKWIELIQTKQSVNNTNKEQYNLTKFKHIPRKWSLQYTAATQHYISIWTLLQKANHQVDGGQSRLRTKEKSVQHKTHIKDIKKTQYIQVKLHLNTSYGQTGYQRSSARKLVSWMMGSLNWPPACYHLGGHCWLWSWSSRFSLCRFRNWCQKQSL